MTRQEELELEILCLKEQLKECCHHNMELVREIDKLNQIVYKCIHDEQLKEYEKELIKENTIQNIW